LDAHLVVPPRAIVGQFLSTFKEYPQRQKAVMQLQQPHRGTSSAKALEGITTRS
jgi:hypothetical protein